MINRSHILLLLLFFSYCADATVWNCTRDYSEVMGNDYQIPTVNITLNRNIPDNTVLYTYKRMTPGVQSLKGCKSTDIVWHSTLQNATQPVYEGSVDGFNVAVYPTSVPGLGISINDVDSASTGYKNPIKAFPSILSKNVLDSDIHAMGMWVDIRLWKIAGDIPLQSGAITFTGPTINQGVKSKVAADTFSDTLMSPDPGKWFTGSYSHIVGGVNLINSTCDIQGRNKIVDMGTFDASSWGNSAWKDASFNIICPNAYGYGGVRGGGSWNGTTGLGDYGTVQSANSVKNNPLTIRILPRTSIVTQDIFGNLLKGTIALDGTGAKGYGVQLAWGDAAVLGAGQPSTSVMFNSPILLNSLNSAAYRGSAYDLASSAITSGKDGTIKMAARFVRTNGSISPGPAKASVEVLINYE